MMDVELVSLKRNPNEEPMVHSLRVWGLAYVNALMVIKNTKSDLVVFCGGLLEYNSSLTNFIADIKALQLNKELVVVVEVCNDMNLGNCIHILECGKGCVSDNRITPSQLFAQSKNVYSPKQRNVKLPQLYEKLKNNIFMVKGKRCCVVQCGEINFLENCANFDVRIRPFNGNGCTDVDFERMLKDDVDVVLDVIHTPMGEQGKLQEKYQWICDLSEDKACFAVCNSGERVSKLKDLKSLQYGFKSNGKNPINGTIIAYSNEDVITRVYTI